METKGTILVAGATGQQGGAVTRALLRKGFKVRALTRSTQTEKARVLAGLGAQLAPGDLTDPVSLAEALQGVDGVFGVTTPYESGIDADVRQGLTLFEAVNKAKVGHFVFSSVGKADTGTGIPHFDSKYEVEKKLRDSKLNYTIIAPVFFMDNWLSPWFLPSLKEGNVALAMPAERNLAHIAVEDIGNFAALIFDRGREFFGKRFDIAGDDVSGAEIARRLSGHLGRPFRFYEIPLAGMREQNEDWARMFEWFDRVGYNVDTAGLRADYPEVGWTGFDQWMKKQDWSVLA